MIGKLNYQAAVNALQRAFVADGTKDLREARAALREALREVQAWDDQIEDEMKMNAAEAEKQIVPPWERTA